MIPVSVDNFRAAETALVFDNQLVLIGGINRWFHYREPTPVDKQPVIRMNRDTLYSGTILDISEGGTVTVPEAGGRYMSVMVINDEHYLNRILREPGVYDLSVEEHGSSFISVIARTFVDASDADDVAEVNRLQDQLVLDLNASRPYVHPDYDQESLTATREALQLLGKGVPDTDRTFGRKGDVEPTRHLIGTAIGWGGLPESEAYYYFENEPREAGRFNLTFRDVPVNSFWSITVYNRDGYFEDNPYDSYNVNSVTAKPNDDGSVTVNLSPEGEGLDNPIYVMDGWNYSLRLYHPRAEIIDKTWTPPTLQPIN
jgi:hypothetical protein